MNTANHSGPICRIIRMSDIASHPRHSFAAEDHFPGILERDITAIEQSRDERIAAIDRAAAQHIATMQKRIAHRTP